MPVRSSVCTYSPSSVSATTNSSKYSTLAPSSLSIGQYKLLGSQTSFRPSSSYYDRAAPTPSRYGPASSLNGSSAYSSTSSSSSSASSSSSTTTPYSPQSSISGYYKQLNSSAHNSFISRYNNNNSNNLSRYPTSSLSSSSTTSDFSNHHHPPPHHRTSDVASIGASTYSSSPSSYNTYSPSSRRLSFAVS